MPKEREDDSAHALAERMIERAMDSPDIEVPALVREIHALHRSLAEPGETLAAETALAIVTARLLEDLGGPSDGAVE